MALPSNVGFGTVKGTFMRAVADGVDADRNPDGIPIEGLVIKFTPDLKANTVVRNVTAVPPKIILIESITTTTNADGVLIGPDGQPDIVLVASDDPQLDPRGWTWNVSIKGESFNISFSFSLSEGSTIDLSTVVPVPSNPGASLTQWQAAVSAVVEARDATFAARNEVIAAVPNGGTTGQVLAKKSNANRDTQWVTAATGGGGSGDVTQADLTAAIATRAPTTHTHTAAQISDATTVGRSVVTAADGAAARTAIGAGTSSLALGTSSTTAAAGDAVVRLTGAQTVGGVKTFSSAPVVPDASFAIGKTSGLQASLDNKVNTDGTVLALYAVTTLPTTGVPGAFYFVRSAA